MKAACEGSTCGLRECGWESGRSAAHGSDVGCRNSGAASVTRVEAQRAREGVRRAFPVVQYSGTDLLGRSRARSEGESRSRKRTKALRVGRPIGELLLQRGVATAMEDEDGTQLLAQLQADDAQLEAATTVTVELKC